MNRVPWRLFWYFAPTGFNGLIAVGSIPVLILAIGEAQWAQLALGQSVGLVGAVVVGLGWPVTGPAEIARARPEDQYRILMRSVMARLLLVFPVVLCILGAALFLPGAWNGLFLCTSIASALLGLSSSWYYLGLDRPVALFFVDSLTRGSGVVIGLLFSFLFRDGLFYAGGLGVGLILSVVFTSMYASKIQAPVKTRFTFRSLVTTIRSQRQGMGFNIAYVVLSSAALPLASFVGGQTFVIFAIIDKIQKQLVTVMLPIMQIVVSRMSHSLSTGADAQVSTKKSLTSIYAAGAIFTCGAVLFGPFIVGLLSVGTVRLDLSTALAFAALIGLAFTTQTMPVAVLAPINRLGFAILGSVLGICFMIPSIIWLGQSLSILGILLSVDCAYAVCFLLMLLAARHPKRTHKVALRR